MASSDYYLKIDTIPGESTDKGQRGSIEVLSWSWGESNQVTGSDGSAGGVPDKVSMTPFDFVKRIDKATPLLMTAASTGKHFPKAELNVRKKGDRPFTYIKVVFTDCIVSAIQGNTSEPRLPTERVSLNFAKIEIAVQKFSRKGLVGSPVTGEFVEPDSSTP